MLKLLTIFLLLLLTGIPDSGISQMKGELKDFLWEKEFNDLLKDYGEETISLSNPGEKFRRLQARPYTEAKGMRIQVFAGTNPENAAKMAENMKNLNLDSVYVVEENGLYKVQIGNFRERLEAEKMLDRLRYAGIENAWIVSDTIHIPREATIELTASRETPLIFSIQVFVSSNRQKALEIAEQLSGQFSQETWVSPAGEFWKVFTGKFLNEEVARNKLEEIRNSGYPDSWLTQVEK